MVWGICKHVLESVGFSQQQPNLFVTPVYRGQVLEQHQKALEEGKTFSLERVKAEHRSAQAWGQPDQWQQRSVTFAHQTHRSEKLIKMCLCLDLNQ